MAVPKKKTSKSRRDKRRANHRIEAPRVNTCPQCGRPKQPHRMCPNCKTYGGREIEPLRDPAPRRLVSSIAFDRSFPTVERAKPVRPEVGIARDALRLGIFER